MLDSTNSLQHFEPQSGAILGRILGAKIGPKPLQLPQKNNTNINTAIEQPKQEHPRIFQNWDWGGVPLEQQTTTHRKDGRVTPCVAYGTVADFGAGFGADFGAHFGARFGAHFGTQISANISA